MYVYKELMGKVLIKCGFCNLAEIDHLYVLFVIAQGSKH